MTEANVGFGRELSSMVDPLRQLDPLFAQAPVGLQLWSREGHSLWVNNAFRRLFGSEPPPTYNLLIDELADAQGLLGEIRRAFGGSSVRIGPLWYDARELRQVRVQEGRRVVIECSFFPLANAQGELRYVASVFQDLTPLAELHLHARSREEEVARALLAGRALSVEAAFGAQRPVYSPNAAALLGCAPSELPGLAELLEPYALEGLLGQLQAERPSLGSAVPFVDRELRLARKDNGRSIWLERRLTWIHDANGEIIGVRGLLIDVSERKLAEQHTSRAEELEQQRRRFILASRLKNEFLANMSHELRTPLNAIIGFSELLIDGLVAPGSPEHGEFLEDILSSARHLLRLVSDVLDLTRVEAGEQMFSAAPFEPEPALHEVCAVLRPAAQQKSLAIEVACEPALSCICIDRARFKQVLFHFLSNAVKFTQPRGRIEIRLNRVGEGSVRLEVEDTGEGIAPEHLSRLFFELQQLDSGAGKHNAGTGIGLVLTRRIVEAQGGSVSVRSRLGAGSVFTATLPEANEGSYRETPAPRLSPFESPLSRVLVVEDEPFDRRLIERSLREAGYEVVLVSSAAEAFVVCQRERFDVLVLNLLLFDTRGDDLLTAVRAVGKNRDVPAVLLSPVDDDGALRARVDGLIKKPFWPPHLIEAVKRCRER